MNANQHHEHKSICYIRVMVHLPWAKVSVRCKLLESQTAFRTAQYRRSPKFPKPTGAPHLRAVSYPL